MVFIILGLVIVGVSFLVAMLNFGLLAIRGAGALGGGFFLTHVLAMIGSGVGGLIFLGGLIQELLRYLGTH
ncbi:hypothetical protein AAY80_250 [Stenotrophomonas phage vB_SmaS-DLP_6]|nr:hypothetical protein AAY80_250 [Stenotrophomonas phage vB_SmaS-DLP_6]